MALNKDLATYNLIQFSGYYLSKSLYLNDDIFSSFHMINGNIFLNQDIFKWSTNHCSTLLSGHGGITSNRKTKKSN